jgi:hypothetical protein
VRAAVAAIATLLLTCLRVCCHAATGSMKIKPMVQVLANLQHSLSLLTKVNHVSCCMPKGKGVDADQQPADALSVHMSTATEGQLCCLADNIIAPLVCERSPSALYHFLPFSRARAPPLPLESFASRVSFRCFFSFRVQRSRVGRCQ